MATRRPRSSAGAGVPAGWCGGVCFDMTPRYKLKLTLSQVQNGVHPLISDLLTISEVARRSGVAASALRFYEQQGLVRSERAGSGHRRFPRAVLRRIAFIVFAQKIGLTLQEVAEELAQLPANRVPERADWARMSSRWTQRVDERIAELQRLRDGMTTCIGCGCLSLTVCRLANPEDRAARQGSGPRYWIRKSKLKT